MAAPGASRPARTERTRAALIDAARRLFADRPAGAVTVDDIVRAAGVGKGSFYNHFADREALARTISAGIRASVEQRVRAANANEPDPARRLARGVCCHLRFALDEPEQARFHLRVHGGHASLEAPLNRGLLDDLAAGRASGRLAMPALEAGALLVLGAAQLGLARLVREPAEDLAVSLSRQLCSLLLRGFGLTPEEADLIAADAGETIVAGHRDPDRS